MKSPSPSPETSLFITRRGLWVISVAAIVFLTLLVMPSPDSLLYMVAILSSTFIMGIIYISRRRTSYLPSFRLSLKGFEGQDFLLTGSVSSNASLPIFFLHTTLDAEFLERSVQIRIPVLRPHQTIPVQCRATLGSRGVYRTCTLQWTFTDPFGILRRDCRASIPCTVVVTPRYVALPGLPWEATGSLLHSLQPSLLFESGGSEFLGLRPLLSGESYRRVHWLTTARKHQPFIKQFAAEGESVYLIAIDLHRDTVFGSKPRSSHETALRVSASIARYLLFQRNHLVGFLANSEPPAFVTPGSGDAHFDTLLSFFAALEPQSGPRMSEILPSCLHFVSSRGVQVILITTTISDALTRVLLRFPSFLPPPVLIQILADHFALPSERNRILPATVQRSNTDLLLSRGVMSCKITTEEDLQKWVSVARAIN
ncbi:MAG: DUF58 domain-containing protein [bacterium JZ-2024 1]